MSIQPLLDWLLGPHFFDVGTILFIGIGLAMALSADPKDVSGALWFFGIAALLAAGRAGHWLVTDYSPPLPKLLMAPILFGGIGLIWIAAHTWAAGKLPAKIKDVADLPRLRMTLILDSVTDKDVTFHVEPETDQSIGHIRARFISLEAGKDEVEPPFDRTLAPDGKPNMSSGGNAVRSFQFDPVYGVATFKMKLQSGKSVILSGPLQKRLNGVHLLLIAWDESKGSASLMVDGVLAKQQN